MDNSLPNKFTFSLTVKEKDIDELNHVNNIQYLNWALKAAEQHWDFTTKQKYSDTFVWVVLRHEIDYLKPLYLNDEINITTYISDIYGVKCERIVEIKKVNKIVVKVKTIWVLLDKKSMKPTRIPKQIYDLFLQE